MGNVGKEDVLPQSPRSNCWPVSVSGPDRSSDERVTPSSLTPLSLGNSLARSAWQMSRMIAAEEIGAVAERLRVTCLKSAYLILTVTVLGRMSLASQ